MSSENIKMVTSSNLLQTTRMVVSKMTSKGPGNGSKQWLMCRKFLQLSPVNQVLTEAHRYLTTLDSKFVHKRSPYDQI